LLLGDLIRPVRESEASELVLRGSGRDRVRLPSGLLDLGQGVLPARADADVEARRIERTSAPMMRESSILPTLSLPGSSQSTQRSCTRRALRPRWAATAATWRVWLDW